MKHFYKNIFLILTFLVFVPKFSYSEIIKKIEISGNERIPSETIKMFTKKNIGENIDDKDLNEILKRIYDSTFFEDVKVSIKENTLKIVVLENPLVENVEIKGPKAKKIIEEIKKNLQVKARTSYNEISFLKDKKKITEILKQKGYFFSKVDVIVESLSDNKVNLIYNVEIGDKAKIKKISFIGDKIFKDRKLRSIIVSEEYKFWKFISGKKYLNQNLISLDERLLKNFYLNKGFYNVKINSSFARLINDSEFELIYNIIPNKRYSFNQISLKLPLDFDQKNFDDLNNFFGKLKGKKYSLFTIEKILDEIDKIILDKEYKTLESKVDENVYEDKIDLTFTISEGEKYSIDRINIYGNNITQENVIRNQLLIDEGDEFNSILTAKSINNIKALNIFKSVNSEIIDNDDRSKIIDITIEEKATGEIMAGAGVGTDGTSFSFAVKENNYLGRGIGLTSELTVSEETIKGQLRVKNPNFKNSDKSVNFNVQSLETDRLTDSGYKTNKTGFGFGTSFEYQDDVIIGIGQDSFYEKIETNSSASTRQKAQAGNYWDTFLNVDLDYDKRNQKYKTSDGFRSFYAVNLPVISENNSLTNTYIFSFFEELYQDNVTKLSFYAKSSTSLTNDDIKLSERIFLPGHRLRGFVSGGVGPKDGNDFIGGNYASSVNIQTSIPQLLPNIQNMDVSMFLDAGNVWGVDYDSSLSDTNKIRSSIGIGVDWFTLVGPLSVSFSHPISKVDTDRTETFKFNLGTTF
ncbi:outer membrane protein assembly factor BamA [Candidatus Pelagibacter sp.]|nr:outer membrane protein assembly factor BamA [Candidatus Pelagibacter sp.]